MSSIMAADFTDFPLADLPDHVLVNIFTYVKKASLENLHILSSVCRRWYQLIENSSELWRSIVFEFDSSQRRNYSKFSAKFGSRLENVVFCIDQSSTENRRHSVDLLTSLVNVENRKLQRIAVCFTGESPLFYGGQEYVEALSALFGSPRSDVKKTFVAVDLQKLSIKYVDELFYSLAANHCATLTYLNMQNKQLICHITCKCVETLTDKCRALTDLRISHSSASDIMLSNLAQTNRATLKHLSLHCRRQEKYAGVDLSDEAWTRLSLANPNIKVTLKFDYSCTVKKMLEIMKPCVPVYFLFLECYCTPLDIFNAGDFYRSTLTKLVVQAKSNPDLDLVLIDVARMCPRLSYVHMMCVLEEATIRELFEIRPNIGRMAGAGKCTLKCALQPHPWTTDDILDEIPLHD